MTDHDTPDWVRLGTYVVSRRIDLGYKKRPALTEVSGISTRILGDIETGRRGNFDRTTIAALEKALGWEPGSALRIAAGGEPVLRDARRPHEESDEVVRRVAAADIPADRKREIIQLLIEEKERAEQRRAEHADELLRLVRGDQV